MRRLCRELVLVMGFGLMGLLAIPAALLALPVVGIWTLMDRLLKLLD